MSETKSNEYVQKSTFTWALAMLIAIFSSLLGITYNKADNLDTELEAYKSDQWEIILLIKEDVAITKTNVENIKETLSAFERE